MRQFDDFPIVFYFVVQLSIKGDLQENKLIKNNFFFFLLLQQAFLVTSLLLCAGKRPNTYTPTHRAVLRTKMHGACFATPRAPDLTLRGFSSPGSGKVRRIQTQNRPAVAE